MKYVAFFRNMYLGRPFNPTREQLEAAFASAGAESPRSFQAVGTVVFAAADEETAHAVVSSAIETLREVCGLREPAYTVPFDHLVEFVDSDPAAGQPQGAALEVTFVPPAALARVALPLASARGDLEVLRLTPYFALSLRRQVGAGLGYPTPFFEKLLAAPATTRGLGTIIRLVTKFRDAA